MSAALWSMARQGLVQCGWFVVSQITVKAHNSDSDIVAWARNGQSFLCVFGDGDQLVRGEV
uniref:Uncharacterized protein n=1 Tax=Romanomermis culicivorax TaxID=13658 RepID=A0A915JNU4_ROMCU